MHTVLLLSAVLAWDTGQIAWCPAHTLPGSTDLVLPMPGGGFTYNGDLYTPLPGGGWNWPSGYIAPMPNGGAWGYGWNTAPPGVIAADIMPLRPGMNTVPTTLPIPTYPTWSNFR